MSKRYPGMHCNRTLVSMILIRQEGRCFYCRRHIVAKTDDKQRKATLDHKVALADGGDPFGDNVVVACWPCNNMKGPLDAATFLLVRNDRAARKTAIRVVEARLDQGVEARRDLHCRIKKTYRESRERLFLELKPIVDRYLAGLAQGDAAGLKPPLSWGSIPRSRTNS